MKKVSTAKVARNYKTVVDEMNNFIKSKQLQDQVSVAFENRKDVKSRVRAVIIINVGCTPFEIREANVLARKLMTKFKLNTFFSQVGAGYGMGWRDIEYVEK